MNELERKIERWMWRLLAALCLYLAWVSLPGDLTRAITLTLVACGCWVMVFLPGGMIPPTYRPVSGGTRPSASRFSKGGGQHRRR